jgi:hypothetical protein
MATYAAKTEVSSQKSRMEIEHTLERHGATSFAYAAQGGKAMIGFERGGRTDRFIIPLPDRQSRGFTHHERGVRTETAAAALYEQAVKQKCGRCWNWARERV